MKNNVTSLKISKALKEAGFKKESEFSYGCVPDKEIPLLMYSTNNKLTIRYNAYQVNEILAELPRYLTIDGIECRITIFPVNNIWCVAYINKTKSIKLREDQRLIDALGEMKIWHINWLKDNGYLRGIK